MPRGLETHKSQADIPDLVGQPSQASVGSLQEDGMCLQESAVINELHAKTYAFLLPSCKCMLNASPTTPLLSPRSMVTIKSASLCILQYHLSHLVNGNMQQQVSFPVHASVM